MPRTSAFFALPLLLLGCTTERGGPAADATVADAADAGLDTRAVSDALASDGDGAEPLLPLAARPGPHFVGWLDGAFELEAGAGEYEVSVYYPATGEGADQPVAPACPCPVVAFAHGWQGNKEANTWVGRQLASWGYLAALISVPDSSKRGVERWRDGLIGAVDHVLEASAAGSGSPLEGLADAGRVGVGGHSMGAGGARLAAALDPRISSVVALTPCGPVDDADSAITAHVQLQAAELDGVCPPSASRGHYGAMTKTASRQLLVIAGGNHIGFIDGGLYYEAAKLLVSAGALADKPATITREAQELLSRAYLTAWFEVTLRPERASPELRDHLFGEAAADDLAEGRLTELRSSAD